MLMPIGRFARASRLSIKSLRNYHESGLLPAAFVDPDSGYRYYRVEQLARADAIRSLRTVEMPLPAIAEVLDTEEPETLLTSHLAELELQRDELNRKAQELKRRIQTKEFAMSSNVTIKTSEAITALSHRTTTSYDKVFEAIPAGFGTVMGRLEQASLDPVGAPFTLFHQAPDGDTDGDLSMCIPIAEPADSDRLDQLAAALVVVEAGAAASIIHRGSYDNMGESYATVAAWVQERGHTVTGPTREIYLNSPAEVDEAELLTEILFPIENEEQV